MSEDAKNSILAWVMTSVFFGLFWAALHFNISLPIPERWAWAFVGLMAAANVALSLRTHLRGRRRGSSLQGLSYRVACTVLSRNGERAAEIREFSNGETYLSERERVDGVLVERHGGGLVGPFKSAAEAEMFIIGTEWFNGSAPEGSGGG